MKLQSLAQKAQHSGFYRRMLSFAINRTVPFNGPHGFRVLSVEADALEVQLPYKRRNLNHVKGLHACALATLAELCTGISLLRQIGEKKYRIILYRLELDYHYQARQAAKARFSLSAERVKREVFQVLEKTDKVQLPLQIELYDMEGHHLATGIAHWQIKAWSKVKLKV